MPTNWATVLCEDFASLGLRVEQGFTDESRGEAWIRVYGMTQEELCRQLNDPVGEPGSQETRHPRYKRRKKRSMSEEEYLLCVEEARYRMCG